MINRTTNYTTHMQVSRTTRYEDHPWRDTREAADWAKALGCSINELPDQLLDLWKRIDLIASEVWAFQKVVQDVPDESIPRTFGDAAARLTDPLLTVENVMRRAGAHLG